MKKYFLISAKTALVLVYLVIIAGALVRMTGSGMGCPDWPKCFGYYIPPTQEKELLYTIGKHYEEGQVIIKDKELLVAKEDFIAAENFKISNWEKYTKHDYAIFNPFHTWVEYLNRLVGALAGVACFIAFILSFVYWKENKQIILLSFFICVLMGFQAWLGKTVVDSVLNPIKITTHMLVALLIVAFQIITIYLVQKREKTIITDKKFNLLLIFAIAFTIVQIVLGTTVREAVDTISETGAPKVMWLNNPTLSFYIHRSFSIAVALLNLYLFSYNKKWNLGFDKMNWVFILLLIEILSGVAMYYFDFPLGTQTIHIVLATLIFGFQFYLVIQSISKKSNL